MLLTSITKYPQHISCQLNQGKTSLIEGINVGDLVSAEVNLRGKEWQDPNTLVTKYFNSIEIWKLTKNLNNMELKLNTPLKLMKLILEYNL